MTDSQDLRIIKTHMALCSAFLELINSKCFDEITVSELCDKAMVRRATFYKHFNDKYDFFRFFVIKIQNEFEEESLKRAQPFTPPAYLLTTLEQLLNFLSDNKNLVKNIFESNLLPSLLDIIGEQLMENFRNKLTPFSQVPNDSIAVLAAFYTGGLMQIIRWWLSKENEISKEEILERMKNLINTLLKNSIQSLPLEDNNIISKKNLK
jgi:AcrR family transcriptional regulator